MIDADELIAFYKKRKHKGDFLGQTTLNVVIKLVDSYAKEHSQRAKVGKWEDVSFDFFDDVIYRCSCCGEDITLIDGTLEDNRLFYCPNCGARMEEN